MDSGKIVPHGWEGEYDDWDAQVDNCRSNSKRGTVGRFLTFQPTPAASVRSISQASTPKQGPPPSRTPTKHREASNS